MTIFRPLIDSDIPSVIHIERSVYSNPWPEDAFSGSILDKAFVIEHDDKIIGFIVCIVVLDECSIVNIAVAPDYQHQGIGKMLLQEMFKVMGESGVEIFYLDVRETNIVARSLYESLGFKRIALRKNYYTKPDEDAVVMCLDNYEKITGE